MQSAAKHFIRADVELRLQHQHAALYNPPPTQANGWRTRHDLAHVVGVVVGQNQNFAQRVLAVPWAGGAAGRGRGTRYSRKRWRSAALREEQCRHWNIGGWGGAGQ
jgi:hypothetical protein